ncbi:MAG: hypothetical protein KDH09_00690 [Chrysiogenetes bacterium]|nr:hypothetical protein [Chrysiogenetes bacterium]
MTKTMKFSRVVMAALILALASAGVATAEENGDLAERVRRLEEQLAERDQADKNESKPSSESVGHDIFGTGTSIGAYGEFIYNNVLGGRTAKDTWDARRMVLFVGHEFSDEWRFFSEIEVEHGEEIFLEQAFIDWQPRQEIGLQAGVLLLPLGIINVTHEPTTFYFSERPRVDNALIPSTFRENGVMAYGSFGDLSYQLGVFNAGEIEGIAPTAAPPSAGDLDGIATGGIRFSRQKAVEAFSNDFAVAGRLQYAAPGGLTLGLGGYTGEFDHNIKSPAISAIVDHRARITIGEVDLRFVMEQLEVRGEYAIVWLGGASALNSAPGLTASVPDRLHGGYVEIAYDILPHIVESDQRLFVAFRGEWLDLQASTPTGIAKIGGAEEQQEYNFGIAWKPVDGVIAKADYQIRRDDTAAGVPDQFNASVGLSF